MDLGLLFSYFRAVVTELWNRKIQVILLGSVIALAILMLGTRHQAKFETSMLIFADNQNLLKPLLQNQAEVSKVQDHMRVVRDVMLSPRLLRKAVEKLNPEITDEYDIESNIKKIRGSLQISALGGGHIRIGITDTSRDRAFDTLNTVTDLFIKDSSESQKTESRQAYEFIDNQVNQYKAQLVEVEDEIKAFRSGRAEGSLGDVASRISSYKAKIESMKLDIEDAKTRVATIEKQLSQESRFANKTFKADIYRQRLRELQSKKDKMLLQFQESYPDVVNLTLQIEDMKAAIADSEKQGEQDSQQKGSEQNYNPLYEELRSKLVEAEIDVKAKERRLSATEKLLETEYDRRREIAAGEAELAELQRDYSVTKKIYEDLLERKEKARLSMTLSAEGQGVSYKIQEPPVYPTNPSGLQFIHFAIVGLFLGAMMPLGLVTAYIVIDPRVRFLGQLEKAAGKVQVLAEVPHTMTPFSKRLVRFDALFVCLLIALFCALYIGIIVGYKANWFA